MSKTELKTELNTVRNSKLASQHYMKSDAIAYRKKSAHSDYESLIWTEWKNLNQDVIQKLEIQNYG